MTIQPTAVYPPGQSPASAGGQQRFYQTYNTRNLGHPIPQYSQYRGGFSYSNSRIYRAMQNAPQGAMQVKVPGPKGMQIFGARPILFFAWIAAMMMVSLDEWHTYHILPRPARLWYTSLAFVMMALLSVADAFVPLVNLFAIGMVIVLGYQYYTGRGQFGQAGAKEAAPKKTTVTDTLKGL